MSQYSVRQIAERISGSVVGDPTTQVTNISSIKGAGEGSLVFAESAASLEEALSCPAAAVITGEFAAYNGTQKTLILCKQPKLGFTYAAVIFEERAGEEGIH